LINERSPKPQVDVAIIPYPIKILFFLPIIELKAARMGEAIRKAT
jgi:hypothetical protein